MALRPLQSNGFPCLINVTEPCKKNCMLSWKDPLSFNWYMSHMWRGADSSHSRFSWPWQEKVNKAEAAFSHSIWPVEWTLHFFMAELLSQLRRGAKQCSYEEHGPCSQPGSESWLCCSLVLWFWQLVDPPRASVSSSITATNGTCLIGFLWR